MASVERTIAIRRPVDQVYRFLSDPRTASQWRLGDAGYEVTALEPERRIALRTVVGPQRLASEVAGEFLLEAMGDATILTFRIESALQAWRRLLFGRLVEGSLAAEMRSLDALQELLER